VALIVQKYGGTSVANLERIKNVASRVAKTHDQGNSVVVILSAMAGITDDLINMADNISQSPDKRELDVLLATGEQTTSALLAMTLKSMNYPAQSKYSPTNAMAMPVFLISGQIVSKNC
jgi:aspartate kinase